MSSWTYIDGIIKVSPFGRTQPEKRYILETVLAHLPIVTGSEEDMETHIIQLDGFDVASSSDEFGDTTDKGIDFYGVKRHEGWFHTQNEYIIVVHGSLRDRTFKETYREFQKWLCRLAKRVDVCDVLVNISNSPRKYTSDGYKSVIVRNDNDVYSDMFEDASWFRNGKKEWSVNWCEYLMWQPDDYGLPRMWSYKYYNDKDNDEKVEQWCATAYNEGCRRRKRYD